jgi:hypothetical protein
MNITFQKDNYIDSLIVNTADDTPLYQASTPFGIVHRTTSIRRVVPGVGPGDSVAEIHWAPISSKVTYRGATIKIKEFLEHPHFFSSCVECYPPHPINVLMHTYRDFPAKECSLDMMENSINGKKEQASLK